MFPTIQNEKFVLALLAAVVFRKTWGSNQTTL